MEEEEEEEEEEEGNNNNKKKDYYYSTVLKRQDLASDLWPVGKLGCWLLYKRAVVTELTSHSFVTRVEYVNDGWIYRYASPFCARLRRNWSGFVMDAIADGLIGSGPGRLSPGWCLAWLVSHLGHLIGLNPCDWCHLLCPSKYWTIGF